MHGMCTVCAVAGWGMSVDWWKMDSECGDGASVSFDGSSGGREVGTAGFGVHGLSGLPTANGLLHR